MAAAKRAASLSPEPGNDNKRLRRSKREPAGRKSLPDGYLATETALKDQVGDGSDYDNDSDDSVTAGRWTRKKKRIKVPSPEPEPLPDDDEDDCATNSTTLAEAETTKSAPTASSRPQALPEDISLTFNVPDGGYLVLVFVQPGLMIARAFWTFHCQAQPVRFASCKAQHHRECSPQSYVATKHQTSGHYRIVKVHQCQDRLFGLSPGASECHLSPGADQ